MRFVIIIRSLTILWRLEGWRWKFKEDIFFFSVTLCNIAYVVNKHSTIKMPCWQALSYSQVVTSLCTLMLSISFQTLFLCISGTSCSQIRIVWKLYFFFFQIMDDIWLVDPPPPPPLSLFQPPILYFPPFMSQTDQKKRAHVTKYRRKFRLLLFCINGCSGGSNRNSSSACISEH